MRLNKDNLYKLVEGQVRNELKKKIQIKEDMNRSNTVRLTESQLHDVIKESVMRILSEDGMYGDKHSKGAVIGAAQAAKANKRHIGDGDKMVYDGVKKLASKMPKRIGDRINKSLGKYKSADDINNQLKRMGKNCGKTTKLSQKDEDDFNEYSSYQ